jgi:predicted Na+-dependent transporter
MLETLLKLSLVVFMIGNLLDMGLRLNLTNVGAGLRRTRFLAAILIWGFVALPALALLIAHVLPLTPAHVTGLVLLGMAPCAPFLPPMVDRAKGDLGLAAVVMLVTAVVIVIYTPLSPSASRSRKRRPTSPAGSIRRSRRSPVSTPWPCWSFAPWSTGRASCRWPGAM